MLSECFETPSLCFTPCSLPLSVYLSVPPLRHTYTHTNAHGQTRTAARCIHIRGSFRSGGCVAIRAILHTRTHAHTHPYVLLATRGIYATRKHTYTQSLFSLSLCLPRDSYSVSAANVIHVHAASATAVVTTASYLREGAVVDGNPRAVGSYR